MATVTFLGAAREVTGSCHLLESAACGRLILDCGMHQGGDAVRRLARDNFAFDPASLDAVILSHAHLDHCGLLPKLVNQGFSGPIYCTAASADLLGIMLRDAADLYARDLERELLRARRRGRRRRLVPEYTAQDVETVLRLCEGVPYRTAIPFTGGSSITFYDAGHILGSAIVELRIHEDGREKRLVFSGDLGNKDSSLMRDPEVLHQADLVLMESTYGNRDHRDMGETLDQLSTILGETWDRGGNVMIPAFAVGRTQELLFQLGHLHYQGLLDNWQIFLDSPMALEVTKLYDKWLRILDDADVRELDEAQKKSLEEFVPALQISESPQDFMAINEIDRGVIVIAGSGMCTGGRIRHHMKHRIWREENVLLFTGFQAQGTLGRRLVDGAERFRMFNDEFAVKARVETLGGFSAHAGQRELMAWAAAFDNEPRLALVHGETQAMQALAQKLGEAHGIDCLLPGSGEQIEF